GGYRLTFMRKANLEHVGQYIERSFATGLPHRQHFFLRIWRILEDLMVLRYHPRPAVARIKLTPAGKAIGSMLLWRFTTKPTTKISGKCPYDGLNPIF
ncbi:MAG: hypothetical protein KGJ11_04755, partial [Candidatus Omnitrophica bacterium]|nr:hypothetical protein [Candidatus Omnitrophota bacterium]